MWRLCRLNDLVSASEDSEKIAWAGSGGAMLGGVLRLIIFDM